MSEHGFDPEKHKLLEDSESWVLKNTPERLWQPGVPYEYNELVDQVVAVNPGMSAQEAMDKIVDLEKRFDYKLIELTYNYPEDSPAKLVADRNRLSILSGLNLASEEEKQKGQELRSDFEKVQQEVIEKTGEGPAVVSHGLDTLLTFRTAKNLAEAKEILISGPIVEGFETGAESELTNEKVKDFLKLTFTPEGLRRAQLGRVTKDDLFLIFGNPKRAEDKLTLEQKGIVTDFGGAMLANSYENYLKAEMFLEGVNDQGELTHVFKIRATAGDYGGFSTIKLRNFSVEKPEEFDYLKDLNLDEAAKKDAYILGTLVHEVAHRLDTKLSSAYDKIVESESSSLRPKFVSEYAVKHQEHYGSSEKLIVREDFAEAMRIYTTNPKYLEQNYPERFKFVKDNFSFVKAGAIVESLI